MMRGPDPSGAKAPLISISVGTRETRALPALNVSSLRDSVLCATYPGLTSWAIYIPPLRGWNESRSLKANNTPQQFCATILRHVDTQKPADRLAARDIDPEKF